MAVLHFPQTRNLVGDRAFRESPNNCLKNCVNDSNGVMDNLVKEHAIAGLKFAYEVLGYENVMKEILWYHHSSIDKVIHVDENSIGDGDEKDMVLVMDDEVTNENCCEFVLSNGKRCMIRKYTKEDPTCVFCIQHIGK